MSRNLVHVRRLHVIYLKSGRVLVKRNGMQVEVVAEVDGWLHCVASNGSKGLVPASYVTLLRADQPFRATSPTFEVC